MCGRYALALSNEELYDSLQARLPRLFDNGQPRWERPQDHRGTYNVAPRSRAPVIRRDPEDGENVMIETMQWGLIPHWTKHPPSGGLNTINARSEGLLDASSGGMWHALKGYKRCIVPAQGYYEWLKKPNTKIAHFTRLQLEKGYTVEHPPIMFFAGLYDIVKYVSPVESKFKPSAPSAASDTTGTSISAENDVAHSDKAKVVREPYPTGNPIPLATFTILTTEPAKDLRWLHDRMPCILSDWEDVRRWLDLGEVKGWEEGKGGTGSLLTGTAGLDSYPVPAEVGKIGTNSATYIQPVSERSDGIKSFFQKQGASPTKAKKETNVTLQKKVTEKEKAKVEVDSEANTSVKAESQSDLPGDKPSLQEKKSIKEEAEGVQSKITEGDDEKGLGDDSNAPNANSAVDIKDRKPEFGNQEDRMKEEVEGDDEDLEDEIQEIKPPSAGGIAKRKRDDTEKGSIEDEEEGGEEGGDGSNKPTRKGGHQTKVIRRAVDEGAKAQPAITSFFKSPSSVSPSQPTTRASTRTKKR